MMKKIKEMTLKELKLELENRLPLEFDMIDDRLLVKGLKKDERIYVSLRNYNPSYKNGARFISVSYQQSLQGGSGPYDTIEGAAEAIKSNYKVLGYELPTEVQLSLF